MIDLQLKEELKNLTGCEVIYCVASGGRQVARLKVPAEKLPEAAGLLKARDAFLLTMAGVDRRPDKGRFEVHAVFALPPGGVIVEIKASVDPDCPAYPSLTPVLPSAHWLEREIRDMFDRIPVGPVHAGIIEPGHFRFSAFGEDVIDLQAQLFYTHRGIEKLAESKHFSHGVLIAERICGACAVSHAVSYAQADPRRTLVTFQPTPPHGGRQYL